MKDKIYPRTGDKEIVYLKNVVTGPNIEVGEYTIYNDYVHDPREFEKNNVMYHYPVNGDKLKIGKFCSIACGAKFLFTSANHTMRSLSTYTFPIFLKSGTWMRKTYGRHGTTRVILWSETTCGLVTRPLFSPALPSATEQLSAAAPW